MRTASKRQASSAATAANYDALTVPVSNAPQAPPREKLLTDAWSDERLGTGAGVANRREINGVLIG